MVPAQSQKVVKIKPTRKFPAIRYITCISHDHSLYTNEAQALEGKELMTGIDDKMTTAYLLAPVKITVYQYCIYLVLSVCCNNVKVLDNLQMFG